MPKSQNQKLKLLYLMKYFLEYTDEENGLTVPKMISFLNEQGIQAERKSIYDDIEVLRQYGMDIINEKGGYRLVSRLFELPELKLLVDAVQSSKFITVKKSNELIEKLETLVSRKEARELHRQVYVGNRVKTMNESIYYNVDKIHEAIHNNCMITFLYFEYNFKKEKIYRHNEKQYAVSPYALCWNDENYYMIAYDADAKQVKHYRVDKMDSIKLSKKEREGQVYFEQFDIAVYEKSVFGMYGGDDEKVTLRFSNRMAGIVIDRFGKDALMIPDGTGHFQIHIDVKVSPQFLAWVFGLGTEVEIISPQSVKLQYVKMIDQIKKQYR